MSVMNGGVWLAFTIQFLLLYLCDLWMPLITNQLEQVYLKTGCTFVFWYPPNMTMH